MENVKEEGEEEQRDFLHLSSCALCCTEQLSSALSPQGWKWGGRKKKHPKKKEKGGKKTTRPEAKGEAACLSVCLHCRLHAAGLGRERGAAHPFKRSRGVKSRRGIRRDNGRWSGGAGPPVGRSGAGGCWWGCADTAQSRMGPGRSRVRVCYRAGGCCVGPGAPV